MHHAHKLFRRVPTIRAIALTNATGRVAEVAACPALAHVRSLHVAACDLRGEGMATLALSPYTAHLQGLVAPGGGIGVGPADCQVLGRPDSLPSLEKLDLRDNPIGPDGAAALLTAGGLTRLTHISLRGTQVGALSVWRRLLALPRLPHIISLDVHGSGLSDEGMVLLARTPLPALESLDVSSNHLFPYSVRTLARLGLAPRLATLSIADNPLGLPAVQALLDDSAALPGLARLELGHLNLPDAAARQFITLPGMARLTFLGLASTNLADAAVKAIAGSPHCANLEALDLEMNNWGDEGALALAASPHLTRLWALRTSYTRIGEKGRQAIRERFGIWA